MVSQKSPEHWGMGLAAMRQQKQPLSLRTSPMMGPSLMRNDLSRPEL